MSHFFAPDSRPTFEGDGLLVGTYFARHSALFLLAVVGLFCSPALGWNVAARLGWLPWPSGSGEVGLWCGVVAGAIILFEMMLWARKRFGFMRKWVPTRFWMIAHIWLGLLSLPLAICHSGFAFGGSLSAGLMVLFLAVIASGVWGLMMQQAIPRKLLNEVPGETIVNDRDRLMRHYLEEAESLVAPFRGEEKLAEKAHLGGAAAVVDHSRISHRTAQFLKLFDLHGRPYLSKGGRAGGPLVAPARSKRLFADLRRDADPVFATAVDKLEEICEVRRQIDIQARLYLWLHCWLCVHVPLSVALTVFLVYHVVIALKFW